MAKIQPKKVIGGLMMLAGGLVGVGGGIMLLGKGLTDTAGAPAGESSSWALILPLLGVAAVLIVGGKLVAGPSAPTIDPKCE